MRLIGRTAMRAIRLEPPVDAECMSRGGRSDVGYRGRLIAVCAVTAVLRAALHLAEKAG